MKTIKSSTLIMIAVTFFATAASSVASAGEVNVVSSNGLFVSDITVTGSAGADNIAMRTNSAGETIILGRQGTTITFEGATRSRFNLGFVANASVFLRAGNDRLRMANLIYTSLDVRLGRGDDFARFINLNLLESTGSVLRGGAGRDVVAGGINTLELRRVEVDNAFASAADRRQPVIVTTDNVGVTNGATITDQANVGETFAVPANFAGSATILGFDSHGEFGSPQDLIDVSAVDADVTQPGNQAFTLVVSFRGNPGELIIPNDNDIDLTQGSLIVAGDVDGDAVADFTISLDGFFGLRAIGPWFNNFVP